MTLVSFAATTALAALSSSFKLPPACNVPTYAIYKPRGVLSRTGTEHVDDAQQPCTKRRTLTDLMVSAGLPPLTKHVGRLDLETGGLILVTADALLLEAALSMPGATSLRVVDTGGSSSENPPPLPFQPLEKTYELLLAGRHTQDAAEIEQLRYPLTHSRGGKEYHSDSATVRFIRCVQDEALATEYSLLDCHDDDDVNNDEGDINTRRNAIRTKRQQPIHSRKTGERIQPFLPSGGWLTEVEVTIHQGRHHQIRRLCARAGLKLRHLRRTSFGPITLDSMKPGDVRVLGMEEKALLYQACVPCLEGAHERRIVAMAAARDKRPLAGKRAFDET